MDTLLYGETPVIHNNPVTRKNIFATTRCSRLPPVFWPLIADTNPRARPAVWSPGAASLGIET